MSQKTKGAKLEQYGFTSYSIEQGGKDKCWKCGGPHWKKYFLNPSSVTITNPNPNYLVSTSRFMLVMKTIVSQITSGVEIGPILNVQC
jgi:hypothetical protein